MKILVGVDGSDYSFEALNYAIGEATIKKAKLTVVLFRVGSKIGEERLKDREIVEKVRRIGEEALQDKAIIEKVEKIMRDEGIESDAHELVSRFSPAVDIVRYAEKNGYDQIIVGSRGRSGINRIPLGSVAEEVVRKAHCTVTVFRK